MSKRYLGLFERPFTPLMDLMVLISVLGLIGAIINLKFTGLLFSAFICWYWMGERSYERRRQASFLSRLGEGKRRG